VLQGAQWDTNRSVTESVSGKCADKYSLKIVQGLLRPANRDFVGPLCTLPADDTSINLFLLLNISLCSTHLSGDAILETTVKKS